SLRHQPAAAAVPRGGGVVESRRGRSFFRVRSGAGRQRSEPRYPGLAARVLSAPALRASEPAALITGQTLAVLASALAWRVGLATHPRPTRQARADVVTFVSARALA